MKRSALKALTLAFVLAACLLPGLSRTAAAAAQTATLSMRSLTEESPALTAKAALLPKGGPAKRIRAPGSASMRRYSDFTVQVRVSPATRDALGDLRCSYQSGALTFRSASYTVSAAHITVSFHFTASGTPGSRSVKFYSAARSKVKDSTRIKIKPVPVASVSLEAAKDELVVGERLQLNASALPETASNRAIRWTSSNKRIATVSSAGLATAKKAGVATITATSVSGKKRASCRVRVLKAAPTPSSTPEPGGATPGGTVYRALLIGNEAYGARLRDPYNDLIAMNGALGRSTIGGRKYAGNITSVKDRTKAQILSDIAALSKKGIDDDVTLFYYSGHGGQVSRTEAGTGLVGVDSRLLSVAELKTALDKIPGTVIVILDACYSGMFIGKGADGGTDSADYNDQVMSAFFSLQPKGLTTGGYHVITACRKAETSLSVGRSVNGKLTYVGLSSYYLATAGGYDFFNPAPTALCSDTSPSDGIATFGEVFAFADRNVDQFRKRYNAPDVTQDMQYFSSNPDLPLFGRS